MALGIRRKSLPTMEQSFHFMGEVFVSYFTSETEA